MNIKSLFNKKQADAAKVSLPQEDTIHGVKIKKLPNGAYIKAFNEMQNMPEIILKGCFPGMDPDEILETFKNINVDILPGMAGKLLACFPEQLIKFISSLTDIPEEVFINKLTPKETLDVIESFWEINDMTAFFEKLTKKGMKSRTVQEIMRKK